jgi:hypothetical protein
MSIDLEKYKKKPVGTTTAPVTPVATQPARPVDVSKYTKKPQEFKFNIPATDQDRQNKIAQYQGEQVAYDAAAKKANSVSGFLGNFGKALVSNIAAPAVGLGKSISQIAISQDKSTDNLSKTYSTAQDIQANLLKQINNAKQTGTPTDRLQKAYNNHIASMKQTEADLAQRRQLPTAGKVAGQVAGVGLDILTAGTYGKAAAGANSFKLGLNPVATGAFTPSIIKSPIKDALPTVAQGVKNLATKPVGIMSAQGLGNVAKGAAVGYGYDVSRGLSGDRGEEREGAGAFIPGAGTAFGTAVPLAVGITKSLQNIGTKSGRETATINKRTKTLTQLETVNKKVAATIEDAQRKFNQDLPEGAPRIDVKEFLAKTDLLNGAVDTNGTVNTKNAVDNFNTMMRPYESQVRDSLAKEGSGISIKDLQKLMTEKAKDTGIPGGTFRTLENEIKKELSGLGRFADESGNIPLTALQDSKVFRNQKVNYLDPTSDAVSKAIASILKETIEDNAQSIDVKKYNQGLSQLYSLRNVLEVLGGKKVEGGRLGRNFSAVIGGAAGSSFGPFGTVIGAEAGSAVKGYQMSQKFGGDISNQLKIPGNITNQLP